MSDIKLSNIGSLRNVHRGLGMRASCPLILPEFYGRAGCPRSKGPLARFKFIVLCFLSACGAGGGADLTAIKATFLQEYGRDFLRPTVMEAKETITALNTAVIALCSDNGTLEEARTAWRATRSSSKRLELLHFGPAKDIKIKSKENLDEWPVKPGNFDFSKTSIKDIDYAKHVTGLPALGYLLFQETQSSDQCEYMKALAQYSQDIAQKLHDAWLIRKDETSPTLADEIENPSFANTNYIYQQQVLQNIVGDGVNYAANEISMMKLANAVSNKPSESESEFSGDSLNDLKALLEGMSLVVFGKEGSSGGLYTVIAATNGVTASALKSKLQSLNACVMALRGPIEHEDKEKVGHCLTIATTLTQTIETTLLGVLGLQDSGVESDND